MATPAEIQAQLDPQAYGNQIKILKQYTTGTTDQFYCLGGQVRAGLARWCNTTNTDTASQQATSITNAMTA